MTDWQPIETAPKDGRFVRVRRSPLVTRKAQWLKEISYWVTMEYAIISPLQWMPLPNPTTRSTDG